MGALYYLVESASVVAQDCFRSSILCSLASSLFIFFALLYSRITDHRISVQRIGAEYFGLSFIQISFMRISTGSEFACSKAILSLHLPRSSAPYLGLFTACDLEYKDTDCHISVSKLCTKLWFFPLIFRFTAGSWISAELDDFRIRIFSSSHTPYYVKLMRRNLIGALTKGEVLRLDAFRVEFKLGGLFKVTPREDDADKETKTTTQEEFRMTALGEQCHIVNQERRYYTFPNVVAQLRRDWVQGNGSFTMVAKESRWTRVHHPYKRYAFTKFSRLLFATIQFPLDLAVLYQQPMRFMDIYVTRADITFDEFRVRDAELVIQGLQMLEQTMAMHGGGLLSSLSNFMWDMILTKIR